LFFKGLKEKSSYNFSPVYEVSKSSLISQQYNWLRSVNPANQGIRCISLLDGLFLYVPARAVTERLVLSEVEVSQSAAPIRARALWLTEKYTDTLALVKKKKT